jgi:hypothetical protein
VNLHHWRLADVAVSVFLLVLTRSWGVRSWRESFFCWRKTDGPIYENHADERPHSQ